MHKFCQNDSTLDLAENFREFRITKVFSVKIDDHIHLPKQSMNFPFPTKAFSLKSFPILIIMWSKLEIVGDGAMWLHTKLFIIIIVDRAKENGTGKPCQGMATWKTHGCLGSKE